MFDRPYGIVLVIFVVLLAGILQFIRWRALRRMQDIDDATFVSALNHLASPHVLDDSDIVRLRKTVATAFSVPARKLRIDHRITDFKDSNVHMGDYEMSIESVHWMLREACEEAGVPLILDYQATVGELIIALRWLEQHSKG